MFRKIILYVIVFTLVGTISYFIHSLFTRGQTILNGLLFKAYLFHFAFSLLLVVAFKLLENMPKLFEQLGFIYLGALVFKIVVFAMMLYPQLFGDQLLPYPERASLLIPVFIFLMLEVFFIVKILRKQ
ncbi:DUF6168 family protein [Maribacter sp. 2210JD10-5]|uniref:DUF6168 family protein n=1 Tax=Maribacter sp. 2210JD10-5 TaxID=3386272 RepID=UPI0039BD323D